MPITPPYRPVCENPCRECPFRRQSLAGWLGSSPPEGFIREIIVERPLPCHLTIDYEDRRWLKKWEAQKIGSICGGSLIYMANVGKLPRDPKFPKLSANPKLVFSSHQEFIDHHRTGLSQSWED